MASLAPRSPPTSRTRRGSDPALPVDLLFDVLVRLPARELCRLRVVCRWWRSLTCDPLFIRAHMARHPDPLLLANFRDDQTHIDVVDLSSNVVKRIAADGHKLLRTRFDLACAATEMNSCRVLNPATAAAFALPGIPIVHRQGAENYSRAYSSFACGYISATGQYKVLRVLSWSRPGGFTERQLFHVLDIDGPADNAEWSEVESRDVFVEITSAVVVDGVVYFLMDILYDFVITAWIDPGIRPDCIFSLDLRTEEWRGDLQGPVSFDHAFDNLDDLAEYSCIWSQLTLADLKGSLALVNYCRKRSTMDLWLLADFENVLWVKQYTI
ncbi:hypothetical protein PR202_ga30458 [Eleusine coracana subsp. coracana]|uniref:F-box domain-containing protein n=1 Tax=Eleusine coracana subsp. coracana TaxID=191504 RepID=A0AAV5DPU7_ELECO|nr:hypothetical protein PR202_ga30458 [Eleusine coracana subsp. coracana]